MNIITIIIIIVILFLLFNQNNKESFDMLISHNDINIKIDVDNFIQFIEYFQLKDLDQHPQYQLLKVNDKCEENNIRYNIQNILGILDKYNKKDCNHNNYISIYDYYKDNKIDIDVLLLKHIFMNNSNVKNLIIQIIGTDIYKKYIYGYKHDIKYRGIVFNPHMVDL